MERIEINYENRAVYQFGELPLQTVFIWWGIGVEITFYLFYPMLPFLSPPNPILMDFFNLSKLLYGLKEIMNIRFLAV